MDNPFAFPIYPRTEGYTSHSVKDACGMSLRDYFAAKAMQGILANIDENYVIEEVVDQSYELADAMLEARQDETT